MTHPARYGRAVALAALTLALSACAAGPISRDRRRRRPIASPRHRSTSMKPHRGLRRRRVLARLRRSATPMRWWTTHCAPSHDLRIALARLDRAEALLRGASSTVCQRSPPRRPRPTAAKASTRPRAPRDYENYEGGARLGWELDLFGRVRRGVEAQRAEADATRADLAAMQVAVVAEVVGTYAELRGLQERLRVAGNAGLQRETRDLVQARLSASSGTSSTPPVPAREPKPPWHACLRCRRRWRPRRIGSRC